MVVTGELAAQIQTTKFVCILRSGDAGESIPRFLKSRIYISFVDDVEYHVQLEELLRDLHGAPLNPKPPIGPNPFAAIDGNGVVVTALDPRPVNITPSNDAEQVYARAEALLRARDLAGWNRFARSCRQELAPAVIAWREEVEKEGLNNETWKPMLHRAVDLLGPVMVLALSAVESQIPEVQQQRGLLDDLLAIEGWNRSGISVVVATPEALALAYHHILGAFLVQQGRIDDAISLLSSLVPQRNSAARLWEARELIAYAGAVGGSSALAWGWICSLHATHPWISHFFPTETSFRRAIAGYLLCASMLEFAESVKTGASLTQYRAVVPPLFLPEDLGEFSALVARTLPTRRELESLSAASGVEVTLLRKNWPAWVHYLYRHREHFGGHFWGINWGSQVPPPLP